MTLWRSHLFPHITYVIAMVLISVVGGTKLRNSLVEIRQLQGERNDIIEALLALTRAYNRLDILRSRVANQRKRMQDYRIQLQGVNDEIQAAQDDRSDTVKRLFEAVSLPEFEGVETREDDSADLKKLKEDFRKLRERLIKKSSEINAAIKKEHGTDLRSRALEFEIDTLVRKLDSLAARGKELQETIGKEGESEFLRSKTEYLAISAEIRFAIKVFKEHIETQDKAQVLSVLDDRMVRYLNSKELQDDALQRVSGLFPPIGKFHRGATPFDALYMEMTDSDRFNLIEKLIRPPEAGPDEKRADDQPTIQWFGTRVLAETAKEQNSAYDNLTRLTFLAFTFLIVLSVAYLFAVSVLLTRPVRQLASIARAVTEGRWRVRASCDTGGPVAELADDFNKMVDMLMRSLNDQELAVAKLRARTRELQAANEHKNRFIANISHELKTPLNAVIGFADILLAGHHGNLSERQQDYLRRIYHAGDHLLAMICDLIDVMKLDLNALNLKPENFDIAVSTREILDLMASQVERKEHNLVAEIAEDLPPANMDLTRYKQVLMNLLSNAVKFTPSEGKIIVKLDLCDGEFRFSVEDNGIGISRRDQRRIFLDFIQLDSHLHRQHEGTGIGLALTRRLVELMGGRLSLESRLGKGSIFTVALPLRSPEKVMPEREPKTRAMKVDSKARALRKAKGKSGERAKGEDRKANDKAKPDEPKPEGG